jgi:hypothetical protein
MFTRLRREAQRRLSPAKSRLDGEMDFLRSRPSSAAKNIIDCLLQSGKRFLVAEIKKVKIQNIDAWRWRIPREGKMRTEGLVYSDEKMMKDIQKDQSLLQVMNVSTLPGIVGKSMAMPDIHWGYGFPIGGVAAFDKSEGIISPGGVGYDIN